MYSIYNIIVAEYCFVKIWISIVVINNVLFTSISYIRLRKYKKCCYIIYKVQYFY
jgi:hypothetical protein